MKEIEPINDFLKSSAFAVVGVSRNEKKFGNYVYRELKAKGLKLIPVHNQMTSFDGDVCYSSLNTTSDISAVISVVGKEKTFDVLRDAKEAGINKVWIQNNTETPESLAFAKENNMDVITGECILMYTTGSKFPHNLHRFFVKLFGSYPK